MMLGLSLKLLRFRIVKLYNVVLLLIIDIKSRVEDQFNLGQVHLKIESYFGGMPEPEGFRLEVNKLLIYLWMVSWYSITVLLVEL